MTGPPRLTALRLTNFRNHADAALALDGRAAVLFGANGAGKTNILEAVSMLAPGRGMRRAPTEAIARRAGAAPAGPWAVSADLDGDGGETRIGVGQDPAHPTRRIVRVDGQSASQADLARLVRATWLTPAQDRLFAGPRGERLKYLDRLTLALVPAHATAASRYEKAMRERTRVLEESGDPAWLEGLEAEMAGRGVALAAARARLVSALQEAIDARPDGAFPKADLALDGWEDAGLAATDPVAAEARFRDALQQARRRDAAAGRALTGPHRTELIARHRGKDMPAGDCSTGEQKALLVGVALAHARAVLRPDAATLILLDEASAHLDRDRRAGLAEELVAIPAGAWLTGTDAELFEAFGARAQRFRVEDGGVREA
ncbi:MAG: DNA replication/repair protein RecF [Caulobacterales bacterium]|nr:DNA replication/repair protein RecF [Caulobacterales bacterium]